MDKCVLAFCGLTRGENWPYSLDPLGTIFESAWRRSCCLP